MPDDNEHLAPTIAAARRVMPGGDTATVSEVLDWLEATDEGRRLNDALSAYAEAAPMGWYMLIEAERGPKPAPMNFNEITRREDLPTRGYTISPEGKVHPLFKGKGVGGVMKASVEPILGGSYAVLSCQVLLTEATPVPWDLLGRLAEPEIAAIKARGGILLTWDNGTTTVLD